MSGTISDNIDKQSGVISEPAGGVDVESSDPAASEGTVWFNTTSGTLKVYRSITGWSTKNALLTAVKQVGGCGTTAAGLSFGGNSGSRTTETEEYDGSSWSSGGDLQEAMSTGHGFGTQTAGVRFGGEN